MMRRDSRGCRGWSPKLGQRYDPQQPRVCECKVRRINRRAATRDPKLFEPDEGRVLPVARW